MGMVVDSYRFAAAAPSWSPTDLTNLAAWYDASDAGSFTYSSGSIVSQWDDLSGNGHHLDVVRGSPSRTGTINGLDAVLLNGTSDSMGTGVSFTAPTKPFTILAVARNTAGSGQRDLIYSSGGEGRIFLASGNIQIYQGGFLSTGAAWGTTVARSVAAVFNGASSKVAYDSNTYATGSAGTQEFGTGWDVGSLGSSEWWQGEVCEFVTAAGEIGSSDLAEWWDYCTTKWGTA